MNGSSKYRFEPARLALTGHIQSTTNAFGVWIDITKMPIFPIYIICLVFFGAVQFFRSKVTLHLWCIYGPQQLQMVL